MARFFYSATISSFVSASSDSILGEINSAALGADSAQQLAWLEEIRILKEGLGECSGQGLIFLEFSIPRIGKRVDAIVLIEGVVFVLEFKVGEREFRRAAVEQVWDYALDLQNFHESSHGAVVVPVLIATNAIAREIFPKQSSSIDQVLLPILAAPSQLAHLIARVLDLGLEPPVDSESWASGRYRPTPTIIEAARALYAGHAVDEIANRGADAKNLASTSAKVIDLIHLARTEKRKVICFVTGVPGAGKTLVGLDVSNTKLAHEEGQAVYLSGNGPLVKVLQEVLATDSHERAKGTDKAITKSEARRAVASFIQNVHHFRDAYLEDQSPPFNRVSIFDEAQRVWDKNQTSRFMKEKKGVADFGMSEAEFLISCMDRHDWAAIVCLVGGGQEINRGEAGISSWLEALVRRFPGWLIFISSDLRQAEYGAGSTLNGLRLNPNFSESPALHLSTSMRSFRAAGLSELVRSILDLESDAARELLLELQDRYPIVLTRSLVKAKEWVRNSARGSERYGMVVSSQAQRLKPLAIDVRTATNPVHWFLKEKDDVRSSFYLEDAATEFDVQGLELDWTCVVWDGDLRYSPEGWVHAAFRGNRWEKVAKADRQSFLKNAYRVLLTRARQGMAIVVPEGTAEDHTRPSSYYDPTYNYLVSLGLRQI